MSYGLVKQVGPWKSTPRDRAMGQQFNPHKDYTVSPVVQGEPMPPPRMSEFASRSVVDRPYIPFTPIGPRGYRAPTNYFTGGVGFGHKPHDETRRDTHEMSRPPKSMESPIDDDTSSRYSFHTVSESSSELRREFGPDLMGELEELRNEKETPDLKRKRSDAEFVTSKKPKVKKGNRELKINTNVRRVDGPQVRRSRIESNMPIPPPLRDHRFRNAERSVDMARQRLQTIQQNRDLGRFTRRGPRAGNMTETELARLRDDLIRRGM